MDKLERMLPSLGRSPWHISLRVNGEERFVKCDPAARLSEVLREELGLIGTKVGCDAGDCGACTVLLDGEPVCACLAAAAQADGRSVTTVEGLAEDAELGLLQRAFLAHGAAQCGICTPGMLMAAINVLRRHPTPSEQEVLDAMGGVLCRCTGYRKIVEAVLAAAQNWVQLLEPAPGRAVGARVPKLDGRAKVTGEEKYGADSAPADALYLRVIRSPYARANFTLGDLSALRERHPGLVDVITAADVPENSFGIFPDVKDQPVFAAGEVRHRGEAVLALVGTKLAIGSIKEVELPIEWQPEAPVLGITAALSATASAVHQSKPENVLCRGRVNKGDVEQALLQAPLSVEAEFETQFVEHAYIEPEAGYAERFVEDGQDRIRVFSSTQTPYMDRDELARILKIRAQQVHIVPSAVGGGFGGKLDLAVQPLLAVAAWKLNRPVRYAYSRPESMVSTSKRHPSKMRGRIACDRRGKLLAFDFLGDFDTGAYASWGNTVATRVPIHASGPYLIAHVRALTRAVYTNGPIAGAFRGFGVPQSTLLCESLMDELAERAGIDKLEFRHMNALRAGQPTATSQLIKASCGLTECLDRLRPVWHEARARAAALNQRLAREAGPRQGKRRGIGIACMWYGIGNTVIANPSIMRVAMRNTGRVLLYNGAMDIGQGSSTILPQICADALGLSVQLFDQIVGDTDFTPDAGKTSASRQAFISGNAAKLAGEDLRGKLLAALGVGSLATLRVVGTTVVAEERGLSRSLDLQTLPATAAGDVLIGEGYFNPPTVPLNRDGQGEPYATYAFAAQMAEVEVDLELGTVEVLHIHAAHDVGKAINPTQVEGQIHGGIAQGLGMALMEEYVSGQTDNLHDYLIPTFGDMPTITTYLIESAEPLGPYGAKGVGEPALIATAPAILNAIYDATGVRLRRTPATPDRVRAAIVAAAPS
jgi:aldehyde oxidoreductase